MLEMCKTGQILSSGPGERGEPKEDSAGGTVEIEKRKYCEPTGNSEGAGEGCSIRPQATAVSMDERGMNLLASMVVTEISKDEDADVVSNSGTTSLIQREENLGQDSISGYDDKTISTQHDEDVVGQNGLNMKKDKDGLDSTDHPDASRTNLHTIQNVEFTGEKGDALNSSNRALETGNVAVVGEAIKGPSYDMIPKISYEDLSSEHGIIEDRIRERPCSKWGGEQSRDVFCYDAEKLHVKGKGGLASDCAELSELETRDKQEGFGGHKIQDVVNLQQAKVHVKGITVGLGSQESSEHCLENEKEVGNEDRKKLSEGYVPCTGASDSDVREPNNGNSGLLDDDFAQVAHHVAKKVGKEEGYDKQCDCNEPSAKDIEDVSLSYEKNKSSGMLDAKEHHSTYGVEHGDEGKDAHECDDYLPVARSITYMDDSQGALTKKREYMEPKQTVASGEAVDQGIGVPASSDKKNVTTEMGSYTVLDISDIEWKVQIKQNELSKVPSDIGHEGPQSIAVISSTFLEHQEGCMETEAAQSAWSDELVSSDQVMATAVPPAKYDGSNDSAERPAFDLNESIELDEAGQHEAAISTLASSISVMPCTSDSVSLILSSTGLATPIAVVARSKGPFVPPINPVQSIGELGWKGSAATSAFRPAEPRGITELQHAASTMPTSDAAAFNSIGKGNGASLDIDLNVAYERTSEDGVITVHLSSQTCEPSTISGCRDMSGKDFLSSIAEPFTSARPCSPVKSDLDLNRIDDSGENEPTKMPLGTSAENLGLTLKTATSALSRGASCVLRDFDLNDGPTFDDGGDELLPQNFSLSSQPVADQRIKGELFNSSTWFSPGNAFQALTTPLHFNTRTDYQVIAADASAPQSNRSSLASSNFFSGDIYTGQTPFSSDTTISFPNTMTTSYPFTGFPFGSSFPLNSASFSGGSLSYPDSLGSGCFPAVPSQIVTTGSLSSSHVRPYFISPMVASGTESSSTWPTPNLDLNTGPEMGDISYREERLVTRQPSINDPVSLEQMRAFCHGSASVMASKRKEPEEGWDVPRSGYKQSTWR